MIPSRGLRWSSQAIGTGRRRVETFSARSARQFSSVQNAPIRSNSLLSKPSVSISRTIAGSQFSKSNGLTRNNVRARFASTGPAAISPAVTSTNPSGAASSPAVATTEVTTSSLDNAIDFAPDSLYNIPEHIGYLKSLGLDYGWGPTSGMEWLLEHVHIFAGTPWWISIGLTAIAVRAALFKPYVDAADNASKLQAIKHVIQPIQKEMNVALKAGETAQGQQLRQELSLVYKRAGIKMWKSFVPMIQMFAGYGTFVLLRGMAKLPVPGLETGGVLWFHNLTMPDPYFVFPLATAGVLHWVLRRGGETGASTMSPEAMKLMMYGLPLLTVVFTWWLPAALQLSFFVSGLLSFGQASLFKMPGFRRRFNMHPLPEAPVAAPTTEGKPTSPYKGAMKVRAPLSQAELNSAFQQGRKQGMLDNAKKGILDATKDVRTSAGTMVGRGNDFVKNRSEKQDKAAREKYEKKREEEIKAEIAEKKRERMAARAAKKMAARQEE